MNSLLLFLLKSTLSVSLLYTAYRLLMRRETFFKLNRMMLLSAVLYSMVLPFLYSPKLFTVQAEWEPVFQHATVSEEPMEVIDEPVTMAPSPQPITVEETVQPVTVPASTIFTIIYLIGVFIAFLRLAYSIRSVLVLFRKAQKVKLKGIRLMIVDDEMPAFSFGRTILISRNDYENNFEAIITHEQSHIRLLHFYDLMLMELVKIMFWFNPLIYRIIRDLKEIHEFQADDHALNSGIDATKYQLLIIQKSVGQQRFALANSFNHCQIKNRIVMMNKQKTSKAWRWKVATFLPLLALLLMAFGKPGENVNSKKVSADLDTVKNATPGKLHTKKFTPPEISDIKMPTRNTFSMQVDAKGKVFIGFDGQDNRRKLLTRTGEDYNIVFSPKEVEEFSKIESFGVPMNRMKAFLNMPDGERQKPENAIGIPYNSGNNEFKNWVKTARTVNKDMHITFKGDQETSYQVIDQLIETLQELNEYRYNLALSDWTTVIEMAFPSKEKPSGEQTGAVKRFTQSAAMNEARSRSRVITVIPDKDNLVYYYLGTQDAKGNNPVLSKTDFSPSGLHEVLINMNHDDFAKVEGLRKKKENGELSQEDFEKKRIEIFSDKTAAIVLIKPTDVSTYGNLLNIIDEMVLCNIGRFAVLDLSDYDRNLIKKAR